MAKQINVDMKFNADTTSAKAALKDLQTTLNQIVINKDVGKQLPLTKELLQATQAAAQLKVQLAQATDVNTGKLNLGKFNQQLQQSGMTIKEYGMELAKLGPRGQQAFSQLTQALATANLSFGRTTGLVNNLWVSLKNTARWQISASVLKNLYSGISQAFGYAKDLNESLNNIRIVTGQSADEMAEFAAQANKAAKALSSSTLAYTDAALIYYQQGLSGEDVVERTNTTIKLANVTNQSAETVSSQMTAIWNNFAEGSSNLEYYADVITALGAATASSSDEIAQGLSKFAAVADTVGLSYEKATAALATVVAETRQSADIVGTAFKTILARMESLKLGETLEDDVTLNKYSAALATIGVNILDANNNLKDMDTILDETAEKWNVLSSAQQVSLAQTVAGVRQYSQFIALMDNYDKILSNQDLASNSEGTLQRQADIYAESWEASTKRVKASAEAIYSSLINDKFFIGFNNGLAEVLTGIEKFIKSIGGVKGVLLALGTTFTGVFQNQMAKSIDNLILRFTPLSAQIKKQQEMLTEAVGTMRQMVSKPVNPAEGGKIVTYSEKQQYESAMKEYEIMTARADVYEITGKAALAYSAASKNMSETDKVTAEEMLKNNQILGERVIKLKEDAQAARERAEAEKQSFIKDIRETVRGNGQLGEADRPAAISAATQALNQYQKALQTTIGQSQNLSQISTKVFESIPDAVTKIDFRKIFRENLGLLDGNTLNSELERIFGKAFTNLDLDSQNVLRNKFAKILDDLKNGSEASLEKVKQEIQSIFEDPGSTILEEKVKALNSALIQVGYSPDQAARAISDFRMACENGVSASDAYDAALSRLKDRGALLTDTFNKTSTQVLTTGQAITTASRALMSISMLINQVKTVLSTLNDENATTGERILTIVSGLGMMIPAIMGIIPAFKKVQAEILKTKAAMWEITLVMGLIVGAIAAIAILATQESEAEKRLKRAKKAVEELNKAEEEAKQQSETLRQTIDKYGSATKKLEECVKGTQEWRDALKEVNESALDIIKNIGNINLQSLGVNNIKDLYNRDNGYIQFNEGVLDRISTQLTSQAQAASLASNIGQLRATQVQADLDLSNYVDTNEIWSKMYSEQNESLADYYKTIEIIKENYFELAEGSKTLGEIFQEQKYTIQATDEEMQTWQEEISKMAQTAADADDKLKLLSGLQVDQILGDEYGEEVKTYATSQLTAYTKELEQDWKDRLTDEGKYRGQNNIDVTSDANNTVYKYTLQALQKAGYNFGAYYDNAVEGNDENRVLNFLENGELKSYTAEQIASMIAASQALEKVADSAQQAQEMLQGLTVEGADFANTVFNYKTNEATGEKEIDYSKFVSENLTYDQLKQIFGEGYNQGAFTDITGIDNNKLLEIAKNLGYETIDPIINGMKEAAQNALNIFEDPRRWQDFASFTGKNQNEIEQSGLSSAEIAKLPSSYKDLKEKTDKYGINNLSDISKELDIKNLSDFYDKLNSIDFTNEDAVKQIQTLIEEFNISEKSARGFINSIEAIPKTYDITTKSIEESQTELQKITKGLNIGDTISKEDLDKLKEAGVNTDLYFNKTLDGTYKLISDADKFRQIVNSISLNKLREQILDFERAKERANIVRDENGKIAPDNNALDYLSQFLESSINSFGFDSNQLDLLNSYKNAENKENFTISSEQIESLKEMLQIVNEIEKVQESQYLSFATTLSELDFLASQLDSYNYNDYAEVLIGLALEYDNTTTEIQKYEEALLSSNLEQIKVAEEQLKLATFIGEQAKKYGLVADEVETQARIIAEAYDITEKSAANLAIRNQRLNKGVASLSKDFADWDKVLRSSNKMSTEYAEALDKTSEALADLTGALDKNSIPLSFLDRETKSGAKHLELLGKAAKGDVNAINQLGNELAYAQIEALEYSDSMSNILDSSKFDQNKNIILEGIQTIHDKLSTLKDGDDISKILGENWINALNEMAEATSMSVEQMNAYLNELGVETDVTTKEVKQTTKIPVYHTETIDLGPTKGEDGEPIPGSHNTTTKTWVERYEPVEETMQVAQINTGDKVGTPPKVTFRGASSSGGVSPSSISSGSGGGGGGGSRSKKEPKKSDDEIERYHVIDKTIDSLSKKYSRLSAAKDAAFGAQRLKYIERENKLLQEQYEAEKQRLKEVEDYYAKDRGAIEAYGAVIDENGVISNYEQIMQAQLDKYNAAVASYNAGSMTDEAFEVIEKEYEEFKKILSQFEETNSEWLEQLQKVEDAIREQIAAELDAIKVKVEVELELPNEQLKIIEFKLKTLEDRAFVTSERLALFGEQAQLAADSFETYADAFKKVLTMEVTDAEGNKTGGFGLTEDQANRLLGGDLSVIEEAGITGENAQAIMDALKEYEDNLIDEYNKLADARKQMWEELNNMIDEYSEAIDNQIDRMEKLGNIAKNIKTLIGTLGKETMGVTADIMNSINESILSSSRNQIEALGSSIAAWETSLAEAKDKLAQAIVENDQDAIDEWNKVIQTLEDKIIEGKERMLSQINDFVEQAAEILQEQVKESFDNLARQMYGMTMDDAIASYDRYKTLSEDYLKDYQKIYELSKLTRNIENSINNTDNIRAKERLRDLQEEINKYQAEGVKMTQYEVDYLTKKYELRQAEIALEEAQNATDKVRLSRNADGGWGYVYTANQENIDQAQQNYEDKLYALQQLNQQAIEDSQSTILQLQKEFEEQILEIVSDTSLTEEERQAKIEELQQYYLARQQVYYDTLDSALAHNQELYRQDWAEYNRLTGYRISADEDYVDNFNETWMGTNGIGAGIESVQRAFEAYQTALGKYDDGEGQTVLGSTYTRISNYVTAVRNILASLGTALDGEEGGPSVGQSIADEIGKINNALSNASTAVQGLITELEINLPSAMTDLANAIGGDNGIDNTLSNMQTTIGDVNTAIQGLITSLTNLGNTHVSPTIDNPVPSAGNAGNGSNALGQGNGGSGRGGSPGGPGGSQYQRPSSDSQEETYSYYQIVLINRRTERETVLATLDSRAAAEGRFQQYKKDYKYSSEYKMIKLIGMPGNKVLDYANCLLQVNSAGPGGGGINSLQTMATGGYTGSFGPDGRMAMLHEKELVLNKQDTQNVLQMVAMAREALGQPVNLPLSSIGAIKANFKNQNNSGLGLQEVHIEAHFPNVVNHLEIEEALRNLANYTAQNAYNFDFSNRVNIF